MKIAKFKRIFLFFLIPIFKILNIFFIKKNRPKAIIVFSTAKLGDMVCMSPIFKALKKANPNSMIIFIGQSPFINIFTNSSYLDEKVGFKNSQEMQSFSWIFKTWKYLNHKYSIKHYGLLT